MNLPETIPPPPLTSPAVTPRRGWSRKRWLTLIIGLAVFAFLFIGCSLLVPFVVLSGGPMRCLLPQIPCYGNPSGPPVSWAEQVAVAEQQIAKIDKTAALHNVSAAPVMY